MLYVTCSPKQRHPCNDHARPVPQSPVQSVRVGGALEEPRVEGARCVDISSVDVVEVLADG